MFDLLPPINRRRWRSPYLVVGSFFLLALFYHFVVVPFKDEEHKTKDQAEEVSAPAADLTFDAPEKTYEKVMEAREGDVYRIGAGMRSDKDARVELFVRSPFNELLKVGEWEGASQEEFSYYEKVFVTPGIFTDVVVRLKKEEGVSPLEWRRSAVFLDNFFITRLEIDSSSDLSSLRQTAYAVGGVSAARLEDTGKHGLYTLDLSGEAWAKNEPVDKSATVSLNKKTGLYEGKQQPGEYFTYRFDLLYPFEKLLLEAEQAGTAKHELSVAYSFDGQSWQPVTYTQERGEPQQFGLIIEQPQNETSVYVRVSYNGGQKKDGEFSLKRLFLRALLQRAP